MEKDAKGAPLLPRSEGSLNSKARPARLLRSRPPRNPKIRIHNQHSFAICLTAVTFDVQTPKSGFESDGSSDAISIPATRFTWSNALRVKP